MPKSSKTAASDGPIYAITGPTSGIGLATALELAKHGAVILIGRDKEKLTKLQQTITRRGQRALTVVCDLSDPLSARSAAAEIVAFGLPIAGLLNNAGIMQVSGATKNKLGWDLTFATNHLGPFALTEALVPHLADGAKILFVVSAVEDPERKPAVAAGFRGGQYLSAEASTRGEWSAGGSTVPGFDAYATSKQALLAATLAFARETPRLRFNAVEPGWTPATRLGNADGFVRFLQQFVIPILVPVLRPFLPILSTPKRAARVLTGILLDQSGGTGLYYDEHGRLMHGSAIVHDAAFQDRVVAETRAVLSRVSHG